MEDYCSFTLSDFKTKEKKDENIFLTTTWKNDHLQETMQF